MSNKTRLTKDGRKMRRIMKEAAAAAASANA